MMISQCHTLLQAVIAVWQEYIYIVQGKEVHFIINIKNATVFHIREYLVIQYSTTTEDISP